MCSIVFAEGKRENDMCHFEASRSDMELAQFGLSQRGAKKLMFYGFEYVKDRDFTDSTNWRCALFRRHKCRARAITKDVKGDTYVRLTNDAHNHDVREYRKTPILMLKQDEEMK